MTEEQIDILRKALSLYRFSLAMQADEMERAKYADMLEELSKLIETDVSYWSLCDVPFL